MMEGRGQTASYTLEAVQIRYEKESPGRTSLRQIQNLAERTAQRDASPL
jgi:hypothetical protein